jgi:homoserine acetyltransferase
MRQITIASLILCLTVSIVFSQANYPGPIEGNYIIRDFKFETGEVIKELKLHYTTIGKPVKDKTGLVRNAVLIMHGTTGSGRGFLGDRFAGKLFGPGQFLDAAKYFIILTDANDMIYQFDSSRFYNPAPHLEKIKAPLYAINSADDQVNPPELGILEKEIKRVKQGRYILIPISDETSGHGTHSNPDIWGKYLAELLAKSQPGGEEGNNL